MNRIVSILLSGLVLLNAIAWAEPTEEERLNQAAFNVAVADDFYEFLGVAHVSQDELPRAVKKALARKHVDRGGNPELMRIGAFAKTVIQTRAGRIIYTEYLKNSMREEMPGNRIERDMKFFEELKIGRLLEKIHTRIRENESLIAAGVANVLRRTLRSRLEAEIVEETKKPEAERRTDAQIGEDLKASIEKWEREKFEETLVLEEIRLLIPDTFAQIAKSAKNKANWENYTAKFRAERDAQTRRWEAQQAAARAAEQQRQEAELRAAEEAARARAEQLRREAETRVASTTANCFRRLSRPTAVTTISTAAAAIATVHTVKQMAHTRGENFELPKVTQGDAKAWIGEAKHAVSELPDVFTHLPPRETYWVKRKPIPASAQEHAPEDVHPDVVESLPTVPPQISLEKYEEPHVAASPLPDTVPIVEMKPLIPVDLRNAMDQAPLIAEEKEVPVVKLEEPQEKNEKSSGASRRPTEGAQEPKIKAAVAEPPPVATPKEKPTPQERAKKRGSSFLDRKRK